MSYNEFNILAVIIFVTLSILGLLQSYINLRKNQYSKFFIDAIMLFVLTVVKGEKIAKKEAKNKVKLHKIGWLTLMGSLLSIYYAIDWYFKYVK